ncbi:alanine / glycine:cation symporter AGCS family [Thiolapillus brandeum]|uniref:Alanine / glycine:cation symporter AGCS family n=1 Tax=Thiolapillus brandeum TaxID=1076588 RepID=A0A7U6GIT7_9GAMM|nr:alanine / glycine:cation symporter AGCS family [Thiolapillus brandeum]
MLAAMIAAQSAMAGEEAAAASILNNGLVGLNGWLDTLLFFDVFPGEGEFPFIVAWLIAGAIFLTVKMGFINFRLLGHSVAILRGRYSRPDDVGEVTPFQALTTALSATVGLGNIAGVAIAIGIGGPGATFWMIIAGLLGMSTKFTEASLAQMYRETRPDGHVMGGAMEYLSRGFADMGWKGFGKILAVLFSILTIGASLGGGNAFQVNQSLTAVKQQIPYLAQEPWIYGMVMGFLVGIVIIGGIRRIAHVAEAIVPTMVGIYLTAACWIVFSNVEKVPEVFSLIFSSAFSMEAGMGAFVGIMVQGFRRAAFSSEAGIGSAAIAHSTARTPYPVRQGIVALMEPFIDTVVICTMTALVIIITGVYDANGQHAELIANNQGAALTAMAFGSVISWFPVVLSISVVLFAYSTMISWSYYGERCWTYMFGERWSMIYKLTFVLVIVAGSIGSASAVLNFSDYLLLSMAFPNMFALYALSGRVKRRLDNYLEKLRSGELDREVRRG